MHELKTALIALTVYAAFNVGAQAIAAVSGGSDQGVEQAGVRDQAKKDNKTIVLRLNNERPEAQEMSDNRNDQPDPAMGAAKNEKINVRDDPDSPQADDQDNAGSTVRDEEVIADTAARDNYRRSCSGRPYDECKGPAYTGDTPRDRNYGFQMPCDDGPYADQRFYHHPAPGMMPPERGFKPRRRFDDRYGDDRPPRPRDDYMEGSDRHPRGRSDQIMTISCTDRIGTSDRNLCPGDMAAR